tara:strand:+ start:1916 stop:2629 length:714 start_codon:yes stop_codon:yes gene_type:complete
MLSRKLGNALETTKTGFNIYSLVFDGTDEGVTINGVNDSFSSDQGTITFWAKVDTMTSSSIFIAFYVDADNFVRIQYQTYYNEVRGYYKGGGSPVYAKATDAIENDGKWHNITFTWDTSADEIKLYLDGTLKQTTGSLPEFEGDIAKSAIGNNSTGGNYVKATITKVAVFNQVKSASLLMANTQEPLDLAGMEGLLGYWKFDEGSGSTAFDGSGNGNNGTLENSPPYTTDVPYKANA